MQVGVKKCYTRPYSQIVYKKFTIKMSLRFEKYLLCECGVQFLIKKKVSCIRNCSKFKFSNAHTYISHVTHILFIKVHQKYI